MKNEIKDLIDGVESDLTAAEYFVGMMEEAANTRFCWWPGQSRDGRKHGELIGKDAFPWEGASDARVRLVDDLIAEDVRQEMMVLRRAQPRVVGTEAGDLQRAGKQEILLKWLLGTPMREMVRREMERALQWRRTYGLAFMGVFWRGCVKVVERPVSLEQLLAAVQNEGTPEVLDAFADEAREDEAVSWLMMVVPDLDRGQARKAVRALRVGETAVLELPENSGGLPEWRALKPWVDVFFPVDVADVQEASRVSVRELLTEAALREKALAEGWNERWLARVIEAGPESKHDNRLGRVRHRVGVGMMARPVELFGEEDELFEVFRVYRKVADERSGALRVECAVISRRVNDAVAKMGLHPYAHGKYPVVAMPYELIERRLADSRSVPELLLTDQEAVKMQRDFRSDRASIAILPPLRVPARRATAKLVMGPGVQIPDRTGGQFSFMAPPAFDQGSGEMDMTIRMEVDRRFGKDADPARRSNYVEDLADKVAGFLSSCLEQTLALCQQYLPPTKISRIVGGRRQVQEMSREDIAGAFDLQIRVILPGDAEEMGKRLELISERVVPLDTTGSLNRAKLVQLLTEYIDPRLAEELVDEEESVTQREVEDEMGKFALLSAGVEPPMKEGVNAGLRAQVLTEMIQANPQIQERMQGDEMFRGMIEKRLQHFQFLLQQQENAVIGRIGVKPGV